MEVLTFIRTKLGQKQDKIREDNDPDGQTIRPEGAPKNTGEHENENSNYIRSHQRRKTDARLSHFLMQEQLVATTRCCLHIGTIS